MKSLTCIIFAFLAIQMTAWAQSVNVTFAWDASDSAASATPDNPVKYRLYQCSDAAYTQCTPNEAGTALERQLALASGTYWILARAWWYALTVDGKPSGDVQESGNSNVLKVEVHVPPGNPKNARVKVSNVADSTNGQTLGARRIGD